MKYLLTSTVIIAFSCILNSCSSTIYKEVYPTLLDGRYDSEFPYRGCSKQLEEISETVKRITVMAHYKTYSFQQSDSIRLSDITKDFLGRLEPVAAYQHHSVAGTGTVIYNENNRVALLTCAHVINFPETLVTRYVEGNSRTSPYLRSIAVKMSQLIFLNDVAGGLTLEILAIDPSSDLALVGQQLEERQSRVVRVFRYPLGQAQQLEWGSFVYVFGYPSGYRTITKGIVSLPDRVPRGTFVVDAVVSPGSSGSIALAIRDGVPNFELVGIIKLIPAQVSYILAPAGEGDVEYDPLEPYRGEVFVHRKSEAQQGIALAISTEMILSFIENNNERLMRKGYNLARWAERNQPAPQK